MFGKSSSPRRGYINLDDFYEEPKRNHCWDNFCGLFLLAFAVTIIVIFAYQSHVWDQKDEAKLVNITKLKCEEGWTYFNGTGFCYKVKLS